MASAGLRAYLELTRPINSLAAGILTFIGGFVAGGVGSHPVPLAAAVAATWLATGAGNAINDYFDRDIDAINNPERPIPRGAIPATHALWFSLALFGAAIALALTLPVLAILIAAVNLAGLVAYTEFFKGTPGAGNALVAYLGGSTFLFGAAAVDHIFAGAVLFVLAALSTFSREVIKDLEDIKGDRSEGLQTLPVAIGERSALRVGAAVLLVAVIASPVPYLTGLFGLPYLAIVVPADILMLAASWRSFADPATGQQWLKYGMFLAAAAFVVGRASLLVA